MNSSARILRLLCSIGALMLVVLRGWSAETGAARASEADVLLDLLQQKGLITTAEAAAVRAEVERRIAQTAEPTLQPEKPQVGRRVRGVEVYGDARMRFEHRSGQDGAVTGDDRLERNRWRYRLRAGARLALGDEWRAGIQLETGPSGRSSNVTIGDDPGPWGKNSDGMFLGLLYLNWAPTDWFGATVGRQANPFKVTSLVWDGDLTPEGISESFRHQVGSFGLFATFGQYVYDDANPDNVFGAGPEFSDAFLFVHQVGARYDFSQEVSVQIAPVLHVYSGGGDSHRVPFVGTEPINSVGINDLLVLEIPMEIKFQAGSVPVRVFGDFALNLKGEDRALAAGTADAVDEIYAWQAGMELGSTEKRGGWSLRTFYQVADLYALDANLVDTDLFDSRLNLQGVVVQGVYAFTDFLKGSVTYGHGDRKNRSLPTGAVGDLGGANGTAFLEDYQLLQADLNLGF